MINEKWRARSRLLAFAALCLLSSCGAGTGSVAMAPDGGISGSGNSVGAVQGFGSIIVNGREFDVDAATIRVDGAPATQSDLRVGHVVVVAASFDDFKASHVDYRSRLEGPVQSIAIADAALGEATLVVLGQVVATNAGTNFVDARLDPTAANALSAGDLVEISGVADAAGTLVASFLERKPSLDEYKVSGVVESASGSTLRIGGLSVDASAAGDVPDVGDFVEAIGRPEDFDAGASTFVASSIETIDPVAPAAGEWLDVGGYVTRFISSTDFDVDGVRVTTTAATRYKDGSPSALVLNARVCVEGRVDSSGRIVASEVEFESVGAVRIEGEVEQIDAARQRLVVLGVEFAVRAETELEDDSDADVEDFAFADIGVGDRIEMRGFLDGADVVASELERTDPEASARLRGRVSAKNVAASTVVVLGVVVTGDDDTVYDPANDRAQFFAEVQPGDFVDATWATYSSTALPADELGLADEDD